MEYFKSRAAAAEGKGASSGDLIEDPKSLKPKDLKSADLQGA